MDVLTTFMQRGDFLPHGYCFTWTPDLLWSMVGADVLIALSYFSIPLVIGSFVRKRRGASMNGVAWLFCAFIFACGITHVMDVWTIWVPDYGLQALTKMLTAAISLVTAVMLWPLLPKALKIPSVTELQAVIGKLEAEAGKRLTAEALLDDFSQALAATLDSIGAGFISTDSNGRIVMLNRTAERITGWSHHEARGTSFWRVLPREGRPADMETRNPVDVIRELGHGMDIAHHIVAVSKSGKRTPLEVKATVTESVDGEAKGMVLVLRDLSEVGELQAETARLAAIVKSSRDAIVGKTLTGVITSWNDAAQTLFGYSGEEVIGRSVRMLIPSERQFEELPMLTQIGHGEAIEEFDTVRRRKDGKLIDVSIAISPIRDVQGRIIGASKTARDITRRRQAEYALRASEAQLRFTLEVADVGDWEMDVRTGAIKCSSRVDRCFGYDTPRHDWTADRFLAHVVVEDRAAVSATVRRALADGSDWHVECQVVWPDASVHWIEMRGSEYDGADARMLGIIMDTTRRRQAESVRLRSVQLEAENIQAIESNRLKSRFLANMSHELRTPLTAIIGFADLLRSGKVSETTAQQQLFLGHIAKSGHHLLRLINDILDLSKVEAGKLDFYPEAFHIEDAVDEVREILQRTMLGKHLSLRLDVDAALGAVSLDLPRFKQVLYNYLSNAIKFSPEDGAITVRATPAEALQFRLEVEDEGIGISAGDLPRLFNEFQQLDGGSKRQHPGTGLGLALVRRLVEAQGGSAGVRSILGVGSVFHVTLPMTHVTGPEAAQDAPASPAQRRRLLVIGDDHSPRRRLVERMQRSGFEVDVASDDTQAVQLAKRHVYDAMTLDLMLPTARHGLGALQDIRDLLHDPETPVISLSVGVGSEDSAVLAITDVLAKPLRNDELLIAMARLRGDGTRKLRVLVIDDDQSCLDLMHAMLVAIGAEPVCRIDAREALRTLDELRPDAVVLDLTMPGFDGFQTLDALRGRPEGRNLPVFIWTSMSLSDEEYRGLSRSAATIVQKSAEAPLAGPAT